MEPSEMHADRRRRLLENLPPATLAIVPPSSVKQSSADASHRYSPNRNLLYLTGIAQENTWLLMFKDAEGAPGEVLFIEPFDPEYEKWFGRRLTKEEASALTGIGDCRTDEGWRAAVERVVSRLFLKEIFIDYPVSGISRSPGSRQRFALEMRDAFPHLQHGRLSGLINQLRMVKDDHEISMLRKAIDITGSALARALPGLRPGMRECEFEGELVRTFLGMGGEEAFPTIVAGGPRATCLHYDENSQVLEEGWLLLADFGASFGYYSADITRTAPVSGRFTARQKDLMEIVLTVQKEAIRLLRPGRTVGAWNTEVAAFYADLLLEKGEITEKPELEKLYYHRTGHHLGLDTHDEAVLDMPLAPGMVLTVEPGFYSAKDGLGIRIEDDVMVGAEENTVLSADVPRTPEAIEELMRGGV